MTRIFDKYFSTHGVRMPSASSKVKGGGLVSIQCVYINSFLLEIYIGKSDRQELDFLKVFHDFFEVFRSTVWRVWLAVICLEKDSLETISCAENFCCDVFGSQLKISRD